jgi:hypothetical protein
LWIILGLGWLGVLAAGVSLFRLADYADRKVRGFKVRRFPGSAGQRIADPPENSPASDLPLAS